MLVLKPAPFLFLPLFTYIASWTQVRAPTLSNIGCFEMVAAICEERMPDRRKEGKNLNNIEHRVENNDLRFLNSSSKFKSYLCQSLILLHIVYDLS